MSREKVGDLEIVVEGTSAEYINIKYIPLPANFVVMFSRETRHPSSSSVQQALVKSSWGTTVGR